MKNYNLKVRIKLGNRLFKIFEKLNIVNQFSVNFICVILFSSIRINLKNQNVWDNSFRHRFFYSRLNRVFNYLINGIYERQNLLFNEYLLNFIDFKSTDTVIDCGANIGEIGFFLNYKFGINNIFSFEPEKLEYSVLCKNLPNSNNFNLGLYSKTDKILFYSKNKTGDSSIFFTNDSNVNEINVVSLDSIFLEHNITNCKLLKLEAEGAEPEILLGAKESISKIEYISVDCGPERGIDLDKTISEVNEFLVNNNFKLIEINSKRTILLFKNKSIL